MTSSPGPDSPELVEGLSIPHRFHGPPRSGNGGWTSGALAERLAVDHPGTAITAALRLPPPLETPLTVTPTDAGIAATTDGRTVVEARLAVTDPTPVEPVSVDAAAAAEGRYRGHHRHPFPSCFTCGPAREPGDGLRIFPGALAHDPRVAATWTPYDVSVPITWAALDCVGGWASDIDERPMVLGTMTLRIDRAPVSGEHYVVVGEVRGSEGRKTFTAASLYDADGGLRATAEHVWIAINVEDFS
jgi:hypothetical protein